MEKLESIDEFKADPKFTEYINGGKFWEVYRLTENHTGKFQWSFNFEKLKRENNICKIAYEREISVPKPEGIFNVMHPKKERISSSFVMEYAEGKIIADIFKQEGASKTYIHAKELLKKEQKKAKDNGIFPEDSTIYNAIWCPKKEKVYLIDFGCWRVID